MNSASLREEIWFARICLVVGAGSLVDFALNVFTLLKVHSGLPIVASGTASQANLAGVYALTWLLAGVYLASGGSLLSRLAFGRAAPRGSIFQGIELPSGIEILSLSFRGYGAAQFLSGLGSLGRSAYYLNFEAVSSRSIENPTYRVDFAWALEHFALAALLLCGGSVLSRFLLRQSKPKTSKMTDL